MIRLATKTELPDDITYAGSLDAEEVKRLRQGMKAMFDAPFWKQCIYAWFFGVVSLGFVPLMAMVFSLWLVFTIAMEEIWDKGELFPSEYDFKEFNWFCKVATASASCAFPFIVIWFVLVNEIVRSWNG